MIKLCAFSISKHLQILFKNYLEKECFPNEWKKAKILFLLSRKEISNWLIIIDWYRYCQFVLKFSEDHFQLSFWILWHQQSTKQKQIWVSPSWLLMCNVHQLLSIKHKIYKIFDANPSLEVTGGLPRLIQSFWLSLVWRSDV